MAIQNCKLFNDCYDDYFLADFSAICSYWATDSFLDSLANYYIPQY